MRGMRGTAMGSDKMVRRGVFAAGAGLLAALPILVASPAESQGAINPDAGVTAPEDLMKEHGVLNRCLLLYEEGMRRLREKEEVSANVFNHTAALIKKFVEE